MPSPYLLLSFESRTPTVRSAVTTALSSRTFAWAVTHVTAVVRVSTPTELDEVIADMKNIEQAFDPAFTCVAVFVPFRQAYFAVEPLANPSGVVAITGRQPG
jgi:hypothetical protein